MIEELKENTDVRLDYCCSMQRGRMSPEATVSSLSEAPYRYEYYLCGPKGMILEWEEYLSKIGIPKANVHYEDFDFKDLVV